MLSHQLGPHTLVHGDCMAALAAMEPQSVDSVVTDPPYGIGFMGKAWDAAPPGVEWAKAVARVLKPGGHIVAFGGTRTVHRLAVALEDSGVDIRDTIGWVQYQGFPKSHNISKAIDKAAGATREVVGIDHEWVRRTGQGVSPTGIGLTCSTFGSASGANAGKITNPATPEAAQWDGWGTALKPAHEPAILARKPLSERTVAANVLRWGTGGINIEGCRYPIGSLAWPGPNGPDPRNRRRGSTGDGLAGSSTFKIRERKVDEQPITPGRWPANLYHCAKPSKKKRGPTNCHPSVKPLQLMAWLCRLVTPPGGVVLDPFLGSGTTLLAAHQEGLICIGMEREEEYIGIIQDRWAARELAP